MQPHPPDPFFANLDSPASRGIAAALFLFIFSLSGNSTAVAPLVMLVLLACLLFRMDARQRALTAHMGAVWLPLFLATYLFFTSSIDTNTGRVVFGYALATLLSGLLPGEGYTVVCAMLCYTLFLVILVTLVTDWSPQPNAARPLAAPAEPARA